MIVVDRAGSRVIPIDWNLYRHHLTPDGRYLLVLGDDARRAQVLEVRSGRRVLEVLGDETRRHSLRIGLGEIAGEMFAFVASRAKPNLLSVVSVRDGTRQGWLSTSGMIGFAVDRVVPLASGWIGFQGHGDGEQYDTVVAVPAPSMLGDVEALQTALREPRVKAWGYRVGIGPMTDGCTVTFRDPEWDPADPPDDPAEAFTGLLVHEPASGRLIERIAYDGPVENGVTLGGDDTRIAVEIGGGVDVVARGEGTVTRISAVALDPYRLEVARVEDRTVSLERLAPAAR